MKGTREVTDDWGHGRVDTRNTEQSVKRRWKKEKVDLKGPKGPEGQTVKRNKRSRHSAESRILVNDIGIVQQIYMHS